jgi:hypothetical protein
VTITGRALGLERGTRALLVSDMHGHADRAATDMDGEHGANVGDRERLDRRQPRGQRRAAV